MKHILKVILFVSMTINVVSTDLFGAKKTTGTPLGGLGASYITYNAVNGRFSKGFRLTGQHWYQEAAFNGGFHLYTKLGETVSTLPNMLSEDEDALIPIYRVNYGVAHNNIDVKLLAFGPYVTGDEKSSVMPLAFFEFSVENKNAVEAEVAVAIEIGDLVGANPVRLSTANGVFWGGTENSTVIASSDLEGAVVTTGSTIAEFNTVGALSNVDGNIVAVKVALAPSQVGKLRFVVGWYQLFVDNDWEGKSVDEGFYYHNYCANSTEAAIYGMTEFLRIRDGATAFVNRIRAVNLPDWYTDRLLNNLYPLTHNSQYTRDGRFAWREGKYPIIGTIDQQGHAQIPTSYNWPEGQWRQMEYWARTQRQGDYLGQIHHDFNGPKGGNDFINAMAGWDEHHHTDYWWSPSQNWSDLNSLFIINTYELFLATGDMEKLNKIWAHLLNTGNRLLYQAYRCINNDLAAPPAPYQDATDYMLPNQCLGSYDRQGATNEYNGTLALNAYSALKMMALARGEAEEAAKWETAFNKGKEQLSTVYTSLETFCSVNEGEFGSYSFSRRLGLPVVISDEQIKAGFERYWVKSASGTNLLEWHFYTVGHFGDAGLAIGDVDRGLVVHKQDYDQFCVYQPQFYFWQDLDADYGMHSYMTAPVVWHSLLLITGYVMDKHNQTLWLRPLLPTENNGVLSNAPLISPGNWGTMQYTETESGKTQSIHVAFDKPMPIKEIRLKNPDGLDHAIDVKGTGGVLPVVTKSGIGLDAILILTFPTAIHIMPYGIGIGVDAPAPDIGVSYFKQNKIKGSSLKCRVINNKQAITFSLEHSGAVELDIFSLNGKKVSGINLGIKDKGNYSVTLNYLPKGMYFARLKTKIGFMKSTSFVVTK